MVVESGEKLEGTNGAGYWPRTGRVHESSRSQVLRFSASLNHRCHFLLGSENHSKQFAIKLAQRTKARQGTTEAWLQPTSSNLGFTPNVGMEIGNRLFHAGSKGLAKEGHDTLTNRDGFNEK